MTSLLVALLAAAAPVKQHPYTVQDQVTLKRLTAFQVSPDGAQVVFQLRTTDLDANRGRMDLWLVGVDGAGLRQLTSHPENDTDPAWSADGKSVYFLSPRSGSNQLWRISVEGGEAVQVTRSPVDLDTFKLSRDGARVAFSAETFPDCGDLECTAKRLEEKAKAKASGRVYDSLFFRHWDTWSDGRRAHLFVQKLDGSGPAVDVMKKLNADAPSKPFGDTDEYTFTPDGKALVFSARDAGREEAWSTNFDLFQAPVDGSRPPARLTAANKAWDTAPAFSPDGRQLAYLAMSRPGFESDRYRVVLREWPSGRERVLTEAWDRSAGPLTWSRDGKTLFTATDDLGQHAIFAIDVASGAATKVVGDGTVSGIQLGRDGLVFGRDSLHGPLDLYTAGLDGKGLKQLTRVNAEALAAIQLGDFEQFSFAGAGGDPVYGYLVKPVGFDAKKKYPLAFLIHGGPQGSFGNHFHYRWNPQTYAGHGYVAVMIDFHGSTGYGQKFTDAIRNDWGGAPVEDLKKGLAAALAKYPFIDRDRLCALGASYGGYLINWIAGSWNEPWKCLVVHDGNLDEKAAYFNTEELWFPEWEHEGTPWDATSGYAKHNPVDHVADWKVPMLVVHGGRDYRVVDTEGMSTFTALQRRGIPSRFLYFPDENHWVLKPANSILWHETVNAWLDQWTKK